MKFSRDEQTVGPLYNDMIYYYWPAYTQCTGWPKNWHNFLYALTLPNINPFSKLFHSQNQ